jgi:hypothetical protein
MIAARSPTPLTNCNRARGRGATTRAGIRPKRLDAIAVGCSGASWHARDRAANPAEKVRQRGASRGGPWLSNPLVPLAS